MNLWILIPLVAISQCSPPAFSHYKRSEEAPRPPVFNNETDIFRFASTAPSAQIKDDARRVIHEFSMAILHSRDNLNNVSDPATADSVKLFEEVVYGAMSYHLDQNVTEWNNSTQQKLSSMATSINETLISINEVTDSLLSSTNGALKFADLRRCLVGIVNQGGLNDGQSCVVNGMSISGVSEVSSCLHQILKSVLKNFGGGVIPENILELTTHVLQKKLGHLITGGDPLYETMESVIESVQSSIAGELVQALDDAYNCFKQTVSAKISYAERLKRTEQCNRDASHSSSVYRDLKTLYLSMVNQFVGFAIPNVLDAVHDIAKNYLDKGIQAKPEDHYFRNEISDAVQSIVGTNSGSQATMAYLIADCLDTVVGISDPDTAASKAATEKCLERPDGPRASLQEIVSGYIQQIYGYLPVTIASQIERSGILLLNRNSPDYQKRVEELHQKFSKTDIGPQYVSCYERFMDCLFKPSLGGILVSPNLNHLTCILGDKCRKSPDGRISPVIHI